MNPPDGKAWFVNCRRCDELIIKARSEGLNVYLSRFSVPLDDARILGKYGRLTFNVWQGAAGLYVAYWHPSPLRPPDKGRLYSQHFCQSHR